MAIVKTVEAQARNGNGNRCGCGKDSANPVESIFCNLAAALTKIAVEVGSEALIGVKEVDKTLIPPEIPPEQAFAFAQAVTAKDMTDALGVALKRLQSPFTSDLLVAVSGSKKEAIELVYSHYSEGTSEQAMILLAQAIRNQFDKIR